MVMHILVMILAYMNIITWWIFYKKQKEKKIIYNHIAKELCNGIVYVNQGYSFNIMMHTKPYELTEVQYRFKIIQN